MPVLQFLQPSELSIDGSYQRSIESGESKALIRRIAQHWNWDLCQPLVVARRPDQGLYVIDGQHRLAAARMRGDILQLPCVVVDSSGAEDEAASFVHLNQQRRPLGPLDLFKAALASEDDEACAIMRAMTDADLALAAHSNYTAWKPGQLSIIGGIQRSWRREGSRVTSEALQVLATAFAGTVLQYAGTVWPGIVSVCAEQMDDGRAFPEGDFAKFTADLGSIGQQGLRKRVLERSAARPDLGRAGAARQVIREIRWPSRAHATVGQAPKDPRGGIVFPSDADGMAWCDQCDMRVRRDQAEGCKSRFCSLRKAA
ncbi:ParB/RepB/Spo0J family partition protein [Alteriqipengyuania lutimaris]|nr:ParB/RepB/Spo0J family partition protein [Alteriqipengyuania lutimaris]MBB3034032.1 hypothetical protein [Alteriqipengyuania lutimaris]